MKLRFLLLACALFAFTPYLFSQSGDSSSKTDKGSASPSAQGTTAPQSPSASPAGASKDGAAKNDDAEPPLPPAVQGADPEKVRHEGGKSDVDAVGNRNVGCNRGFGNWYSIEKQVSAGKQYSMQVEATSKMVTDPVITEYVNRIGQNIVRNSDAQVPFTIKVIDSDEVNAFALPGGFFYVNSGLILAADEEAELAGVMAHEIAHVSACHFARESTRGQFASIATIPLIFVGGGIGYAAYEAAGFAIPMTFLRFSRGFEAEADYLGLQYMYRSGYDPQAFISFFEKLQAREKKKPGTLAKAFSTHPQTPDRIEKSQEEISTILPARAQYMISTSEFDDVKARLARIENRRKMVDQKDNGNKPTLRRTSTGDKTGTDKTDDGDRPTLKRRPDGN